MADELKKETPEVATLETSNTVEKKEEKLLTQEQFDKAIKDRIERERNKILKETEIRIKEVQEETERLAKLSSEEKEKELAEKYDRELKDKAKEISIRENRLDVIDLFVKSKVPTNLVDYVLSDDRDKTLENAESFVNTFNESVAKTVAEQLRGTPPKDISVNSKDQQPKKVVKAF